MRLWILFLLLISPMLCSAYVYDPAAKLNERVLILVNDRMPPENGTGGKGASVYVGEHYAQARGIPQANILHLNTTTTPWISYAQYAAEIKHPVQVYLNASGGALKNRITYIVPTYGIPYSTGTPDGTQTISVDSYLSSMYSGSTYPRTQNPYSMNTGRQALYQFIDWRVKQPAGWVGNWTFFAVTRLDGMNATFAASLVDRAMRAETSLSRDSGTSYFDVRDITTGTYAGGDLGVSNAAALTGAAGFRTYVNHQVLTSGIPIMPPSMYAYDNATAGLFVQASGRTTNMSVTFPAVSSGEVRIRLTCDGESAISGIGSSSIILRSQDRASFIRLTTPVSSWVERASATLEKGSGTRAWGTNISLPKQEYNSFTELRILFNSTGVAAYANGTLLLATDAPGDIAASELSLHFKDWAGHVQEITVLSAGQVIYQDTFATDTSSRYSWELEPMRGTNALWVWGWYTGAWDAYRFVEGGIGSQLTSYTMGALRTPANANPHLASRGLHRWSWAYSPRLLEQGAVGTWGAIAEPYVNYYTQGDEFFRQFFNGYNFGDSYMAATPSLNWVMVAVGDPLYQPALFRTPESAAPSAPTNLRLINATTTSLTIGWDASQDDRGVTGYLVHRNYVLAGSTRNTTFTDVALGQGSSYRYQVTAVDATLNNSAQSEPLNVSTLADAWPGPSSVQTAVNGTTARFTWVTSRGTTSRVEFGTSGLTHYLNDDMVTTNHTIVLSGLAPRTTYTYRVNGRYPPNGYVGSTLLMNFTTGDAGTRAGDINADGIVNIFDVVLVAQSVGKTNPAADLAAPFGTIDLFDVMAVVRNMGR